MFRIAENGVLKLMIKMVVCSLFVSIALIISCGGFSREESRSEYDEDLYLEERDVSSKMERAAAPEADMAPEYSEAPEAEKAPLPVEPAAELRQERKRVFTGYARMLVSSIEKRRKDIYALAEENGGYVESVNENLIDIRVPAERFSSVFKEVLRLGEVLDKHEESVDVTEYYRDLEIRLSIATRTRGRLYALLDRAGDVEERFKILREIRRITEEIETIRGSKRILEDQIVLSRISVELISRLLYYDERDIPIPFDWIAALDPLYVSLSELRGRPTLDLGEDFAVFKREDSFRAESADGVRVRIGTTRNDPKGDDEFWQRALLYHLKSYYSEYEEFEAGPVRAVLFTSKDAQPFHYLVGTHVKGRRIYVIEMFFPDGNALEGRRGAILKSLEGMDI